MKVSTPATSAPDPTAGLRDRLVAAIGQTQARLLQAESSQIQFETTRLHMRGRLDALEAVRAYLAGSPEPLDALARPG